MGKWRHLKTVMDELELPYDVRRRLFDCADALRFMTEHGGDIYELLGTSVANKIEREDKLATAVRLAIALMETPVAWFAILTTAYTAYKAAYDAYLAECRALEPKEEE